jgi:hypothetical protein
MRSAFLWFHVHAYVKKRRDFTPELGEPYVKAPTHASLGTAAYVERPMLWVLLGAEIARNRRANPRR